MSDSEDEYVQEVSSSEMEKREAALGLSEEDKAVLTSIMDVSTRDEVSEFISRMQDFEKSAHCLLKVLGCTSAVEERLRDLAHKLNVCYSDSLQFTQQRDRRSAHTAALKATVDDVISLWQVLTHLCFLVWVFCGCAYE